MLSMVNLSSRVAKRKRKKELIFAMDVSVISREIVDLISLENICAKGYRTIDLDDLIVDITI
jgi:hypothetical protein